MRKISICIPTYNRYAMTINAFANVLDDERISEVIISDDCSTDGSCEKLVEYFKDNPKVKVFRNKKNLDCYFNKAMAVKRATGDWICLWDSDNIFDTSYLDALYAIAVWNENTIYQPWFAAPHFFFGDWNGLTITKHNVSKYSETNLMTALNAMNFFINRSEYLKIWDGSVNPGSSDSIFFSLKWLEAGNKIYITPNLSYEHFISEKGDGHYQQNSKNFVEFHKKIMERIRNLR